MAPAPSADPYHLDPAAVAEPPATLRDSLRRIGPGMILAASIVGSGELIATTILGAQEGYALLWLIIASCAIKPVIQAELGRFTIATGQASLEGFDHLPGPRWKVSWAVWGWALMVLMTLLQVGAMFQGVGQVLHLVLPFLPVRAWIVICFGITLALLLGGGYGRIERLAVVKVSLFTLLTVLAAVLLVRHPESFSWEKVSSGLMLHMPTAGLATAVAVFGVTGVGTGELFMYPYWCVEKGYARYVGRRDGSEAWARRARGWVRVMHLDIFASMAVYTLATLAFYLLGAGVLHARGEVPEGSGLIATLSKLYTETLGAWSLPIFYVGAIVTLYGTVFATTAAHSRLYADFMRLLGRFPREDFAARTRHRNRFVVLLTGIPLILALVLAKPGKMVVAGAWGQSLMLPVAALGAVYLRHKRLPREVQPPPWVTVGLWLGALLILGFMLVSVGLTLSR
jgi:Mn2+/Fe2+ NRAMP family transporter